MRLRRRAVEPIDILVVCTGNLCRSPIIATLLSAARPDLRVASAGTHAPAGEPWHPLALQVLAERGHVVEGAARQLTRADVQAAKLIITAEGWHRAEVLRLDASAEDRTFTVLEAARLLDQQPLRPVDLDGLLAELAERLLAQRTEHDDDIADPMGGDVAEFRRAAHAAEQAVRVLSEAFSSAPPPD